MCGIAGYKSNNRHDEPVIRRMVGALVHRGPDSEGYYSSGQYTAGMRRLEINDLETGNQPLFNADRGVVLFYNGEIYNSPQLRSDLESKGYRFRTHCDGEVICHMYDEHKEGLFEKLDGMFAVALWVEKEKKLILARDIPGEKPLYYARLPGNGIVFSSEIKSIKHFPGLDLGLDLQSVWDFPTFLWIPEPQTIYRSVKALMPGHMIIAGESGVAIRRYENRFNSCANPATVDQVIGDVRDVVEKAVKSRLLSDVPVGSFLSSGLDSSIVTTIASRNMPNFSTFTIGFEDLSDPYHGSADESSHAEAYAKKLGTRHRTIRVTHKDFLDSLETFCKYGDQPFAVSSGLGLLAVAKAAREDGVKVLLSGDGADESFGGYSWYSYLLSPEECRPDRDTASDDMSFQSFGIELESRLKVMARYRPQVMAWAWHYYASEDEKARMFSKDMFAGMGSSIRFFSQFKSGDSWKKEDYIKQDRQFYLPNEMLKKVDRMTMAYSIEGRAPFVAPGVLACADSLKYDHLIKGQELKWVLRRAFEDMLPSEIINRPKHGFNVPIDHWLKGGWAPLLRKAFSSDSALSRMGLIGPEAGKIANLMLADKKRLNGHTLFTYIMLNMWLERCA